MAILWPTIHLMHANMFRLAFSNASPSTCWYKIPNVLLICSSSCDWQWGTRKDITKFLLLPKISFDQVEHDINFYDTIFDSYWKWCWSERFHLSPNKKITIYSKFKQWLWLPHKTDKKKWNQQCSSFNSIKKFCLANCERAIGCGFFAQCLLSFRICDTRSLVLRYYVFAPLSAVHTIYLCISLTGKLELFMLASIVWILYLLYVELSVVLILPISNWDKRWNTVKWNLKFE